MNCPKSAHISDSVFIKRDHRRTFLEWFRWENQFLTAAVCLKAAKVLAKCQGIHLTWNCLLQRNTLDFFSFFRHTWSRVSFYQDFHKSKIFIKNERIFLGSLNQPPFSNFQHFIYTFPVQFPSGFFSYPVGEWRKCEQFLIRCSTIYTAGQ